VISVFFSASFGRSRVGIRPPSQDINVLLDLLVVKFASRVSVFKDVNQVFVSLELKNELPDPLQGTGHTSSLLLILLSQTLSAPGGNARHQEIWEIERVGHPSRSRTCEPRCGLHEHIDLSVHDVLVGDFLCNIDSFHSGYTGFVHVLGPFMARNVLAGATRTLAASSELLGESARPVRFLIGGEDADVVTGASLILVLDED
jgi:hypothetical protein